MLKKESQNGKKWVPLPNAAMNLKRNIKRSGMSAFAAVKKQEKNGIILPIVKLTK